MRISRSWIAVAAAAIIGGLIGYAVRPTVSPISPAAGTEAGRPARAALTQTPQAREERPLPVLAYAIEAATARETVRAVGSLMADETVVIRPEIAGRITHLDVRDGAKVEAGVVLARLDDGERRARLRQAEAEAALMEERLQRAERLFAQNFLAEQAVIDARQNLAQARARLDEARAALDKTVLRAPFAGQLGLRQVSPGAWVKEGQDIVTLAKVDRLKLDVRVPEIHLAQLAGLRELSLSVDAWPGRRFIARILAIDPAVDAQSRTLLVRAAVDNRDGALKPGMFARVEAELPAPAGVRVPEEALAARAGHFIVYRIEEGRAQPVRVTPGRREAGWVIVQTKGEATPLQAGDLIVRDGQQRLKPGAPVSVLNPS